MSDEILKILKMVKEGKITEEEGETLIESLRNNEKDSSFDYRDFLEDKVDSVREVLKSVKNIVSSSLEDIFKGIDLKSINISNHISKGKFKRYLKVNRKLNDTVKNVMIKVPEGNLKIVGVSQDFGIRGTIEIRGNDNELLEKELLNLDEKIIKEENESLIIEIPKDLQNRIKIYFEIIVPLKLNLDCSCLSSDIEVENIEGNINISNISGDMTLSDITGIVKTSTKSGDFTLERLKGEIEACTLSGDIDAKELEGKIKLKSISGDIDIDKFSSGQISVETISGDISGKDILINDKTGNFNSISGDIEIDFDKDSGGNLILRTLSGDISIDGELKYVKKERKELEGIFNEGDAHIQIDSKSGDITVSV